jgi:hypothetical protein
MGGVCSTYEGEKRSIQDFGGEPEGRDHSEDPGVDGITLKWIFKTGLTWLWTGRSGGLVWTRLQTFEFHEMRGNFFISWGPVSFSRTTLLFGVVSIRCTSFALTRQHNFQTHSVTISNVTNAWVGIMDTWKNGTWWKLQSEGLHIFKVFTCSFTSLTRISRTHRIRRIEAQYLNVHYILGAFVQSHHAHISFVYPSVCPHVSARLPRYGFRWNLILGASKKICRKTLNLVKIGHKYWAFYLQTQPRTY